MNELAYAKFIGDVKEGGTVVVNSSRIKTIARDDVKTISVPVDDVALELGNVKVANTVLIGALIGATGIVSKEVVIESLSKKFKEKSPKIMELNIAAIEKGIEVKGYGRAGVLYGAYEFLEAQGIRWYSPWEEYVPEAKEIIIPESKKYVYS